MFAKIFTFYLNEGMEEIEKKKTESQRESDT